MQRLCKTETWMPSCSWSAASGTVHDQEFRDFDAQSEQLASHGQDYLQLTEGGFYGRFVSCTLGQDVSLHIEHANQALSQSIEGAPDAYAIGVVLNEGPTFRANGVPIGKDCIFIVPPGVDFHLFSPKEGTILACIVGRVALDSMLEAAPLLGEWLDELHHDIVTLQSASLADRIRQDAYSAMLGCLDQSSNAVAPSVLGEAMIRSLVASLTLENACATSMLIDRASNTFNHFSQFRKHLLIQDDDWVAHPSVIDNLSLSRRSIQHAFAQEVGLGVSGFIRHQRLHAVRRSLRTGLEGTCTIGDVAARHGFWNWSHFSKQYRQMFGELPSETRALS